jgi:hypothetical protein
MPHKPSIGTQVRLKSFLGDITPPKVCDPKENYWKLIGETGIITDDLPGSESVIVVFDRDLSAFALHCHNATPNSLRIPATDIEQ